MVDMKSQQSPDDNITLAVKDLGPIAEAQVQLRPLTVFIGQSNTGKSWLSVLIYALHKFAGNAGRKEDIILYSEVREAMDLASTDDNYVALIKEKLLDDKMIEQLLDSSKEQSEILTAQLCRCYGFAGIENLVSKNTGSEASITVRDSSAALLEIGLTNKAWIKPPDPAALRQRLEDTIGCAQGLRDKYRSRRSSFRHSMAREFSLQTYKGLLRNACYLPADRTGIMHAHHVIMASLIGQAPMGGLRPVEKMPMLSGVMADFLEMLLLQAGNGEFYDDFYLKRGGSSKEHAELAGKIEKCILNGKIDVGASEMIKYPNFKYQPNSWKNGGLPLMNSSSMVSELAPLVLFLRNNTQSGNVLIIEEPESHLHPAKQTELVKIVAEIVASGVRVILTTHSEWIMEKLSNVVLDSDKKAAAANGDQAILSSKDVGVWLFETGKVAGRSVVKEIPVAKEGYEDRFDDVAIELHNDWADIVNEY